MSTSLHDDQLFADDLHLTNHVLGEGASGRVFLAVDTRGGVSKQVTCKVLDVDAFNKAQIYDKTLHRWRQEIDVIRQLHHVSHTLDMPVSS
jgi:hypothetical protein